MVVTFACLFLATATLVGPPRHQDQPVLDEPRIRQLLNAEEFKKRESDELAKLGGLGPAAFPLYARILDNPEEDRYITTRVLAVLSGSNMKGDRGEFLDRCVDKMSYHHSSVRHTAVLLLAKIGTAREAAPVVALLWDENRDVVIGASKALAAIGDRRAVDAIEVWLKRGNRRDDAELRRLVENCQVDLKERLEKERVEKEKAKKPPAK